ncbi:DUF4912 domain-containing protein [Pelotomaculum propionicicum]|uniref:DUF4912 domain-containing protein n=1 Tax=Pelotomaculum propionicicum TaxID=258475 RepID=UPI003BA278EE
MDYSDRKVKVIKMTPITLPSNYNDNTLVLMVQTPRTLYVYWDLSPSQREALAKKKELQLRLNVVNRGVYRTFDIKHFWDSFYITGVEPGLDYYCDISVKEEDDEYYPVIYSNTSSTPQEHPGAEVTAGSNFWGAGDYNTSNGSWISYSSGTFYNK